MLPEHLLEEFVTIGQWQCSISLQCEVVEPNVSWSLLVLKLSIFFSFVLLDLLGGSLGLSFLDLDTLFTFLDLLEAFDDQVWRDAWGPDATDSQLQHHHHLADPVPQQDASMSPPFQSDGFTQPDGQEDPQQPTPIPQWPHI